MKKHLNLTRLLAVLVLVSMVLPLASCQFFTGGGGSLELVSFTVDLTTIRTTYLVGEEIDFSGIKATAKYSDANLNKIYTAAELSIDYADDITATVGDKDVTVSFDDPNLNVKQETKVTIKVTDSLVDDDYPKLVYQFEQPATITSFNTANADANADSINEFAIGEQTYVIGNENAFKLNPIVTVKGFNNQFVEIDNFYATVEISIEKDEEFVALTKTEGENNVVSYYDGETLIATVNTYEGTYQFSSAAAGAKVEISVLPSEEYYISEGFNAVVIEANIINAYNVYEAWQLAVINNLRNDWDDIKTQHGISNLNVSGIVLHKDIFITAEDVPQNFFYVTEEDVVYTNALDGTETIIPAGTKYLKDEIYVFERSGNQDLVFEGNFFNLDTSEFPLVASPGVFGKDAGKDYGADFSNATLFKFNTTAIREGVSKPADVANITFNNFRLNGNAARNNLIDSEEALASAGGLIFIKSSNYSNVQFNNIVGKAFFITYFADYGGEIHIDNSKCFDSYQNAAFSWGDATISINDSWIEGCGGPAAISMSVKRNDVLYNPITTINNSKIVTNLSGEEIWFNAIGATSIVGDIKALGSALQGIGLGNFVKDGMMNIKGVLMAEGNGAIGVVTATWAQGSFFCDGEGLDRFLTADNIHWATIKGITEGVMAQSGSVPPFLTVNVNGKTYSMWTDGTNFYDLTVPNPYPTPVTLETHAELLGAFMAADTITLTQGGLSVVFDFYHFN